jgi:hypothetical protein
VWAVVEHLEGKIADINFEMLGKAGELTAGGKLVYWRTFVPKQLL